jgi:predicted restriction endonuclease
MATDKPQIDPYLFELQFTAFKKFVEEKNGVVFTSFASHPYTEEQEGYKYEIHRSAREALAFQAWKKSDIGNGEIITAVIESIEVPNSNLVQWQPRYGEEARPHQPLYAAQKEQTEKKRIEACLFKFFNEQLDEESFAELVNIFGKKYPLIAYLFFLKDRSKYLPIAPTFFDKAFSYLGAEFKTSHQCSWDNYTIFVGLIGELKTMLAETLRTEVTLLDAHSFAWMLAEQMEKEGKLADVHEYLNLSTTERDAIVKARIGQGKFRQSLIEFWSKCAVTGCSEIPLLRASHIKPWSKGSIKERLSLYNGLLLSPSLDACFDSGFVSFDDNGKILISARLSAENALALSIYPEMQLLKIEPQHKTYLAYHREHIYKH